MSNLDAEMELARRKSAAARIRALRQPKPVEDFDDRVFEAAIQQAERTEDEQVAAFKAERWDEELAEETRVSVAANQAAARLAYRATRDPESAAEPRGTMRTVQARQEEELNNAAVRPTYVQEGPVGTASDVLRQSGAKDWKPGKIVRCPGCGVRRNVFHYEGCANGPQATAAMDAPEDLKPVTEDGMYRDPNGTIFKVQVAVHGSGHLYAKQMVELDTPVEMKRGTRTHEFVYVSGAIRTLTAGMRMTLAEAKEFGALYGTCCRCGLLLTDEGSIAAGIGPICANKV
jgi:hypothetical protein